jgi:hypothetical protein
MITMPLFKDTSALSAVTAGNGGRLIKYLTTDDLVILHSNTSGTTTHSRDNNDEWGRVSLLSTLLSSTNTDASENGDASTLIGTTGFISSQFDTLLQIYTWSGSAWVLEQQFTINDLAGHLYSPVENVNFAGSSIDANRIVMFVSQPHRDTLITFDRVGGVWTAKSQITSGINPMIVTSLSGDRAFFSPNSDTIWDWNGTIWVDSGVSISGGSGDVSVKGFDYPYVVALKDNGANVDVVVYDVTGGTVTLDQTLIPNIPELGLDLSLVGTKILVSRNDSSSGWIREIYERLGFWDVKPGTHKPEPADNGTTFVESGFGQFNTTDNFSIVECVFSDFPQSRIYDDIIR